MRAASVLSVHVIASASADSITLREMLVAFVRCRLVTEPSAAVFCKAMIPVAPTARIARPIITSIIV
jgi:hypothetical protein